MRRSHCFFNFALLDRIEQRRFNISASSIKNLKQLCSRRNTVCALLATQIILVNLSDSLHRLPMFGIHSVFHCGCCSSPRGTKATDPATQSTNVPGLELPQKKCSICQFFESYVATLESSEIGIESSRLALAEFRLISADKSFWHLCWSRGPPTFSP